MSYKNLRTSPGYAPSLAPCKGRQSCILDSTPWIPDSRYWIPYSLSVELGFRIPMVSGIPDSLSCFLDSKVQDSGFQNQNWIPGFRFPQAKPSRIRITQAKICRIPESGVSYTGRVSRTDASLSCTHSFFVDHWHIEDITCPRVDTNFIFECSTRYLTRSLRSLVRYQVEHEKIQFVSTRGHVIFCLLYRHRWRDAVVLFSYWLRLKLPWQPWYLRMWRTKIVSSLDTKFSSLENSWYFIATCISLVIKMIILETLNSAKQIILRKNYRCKTLTRHR